MPAGVMDFAWRRLPFANGDFERGNQFGRVWGRMMEMLCNRAGRVLHGFSGAIPGVRRVGTSRRKIVIECG
jgi:hypothetical protein